VALVANLIKRSRKCVAYTGAGISTAAGIDDYATKAGDGSEIERQRAKVNTPWDANPTLSHLILASMHKAHHLQHWIQQNHDGLPQKAGFPQHALNEIHGAWYDPSNPVVRMSGSLRNDLFQAMLKWEEEADLCLTLGTSLAGMNADRIATSTAMRAKRAANGTKGAEAAKKCLNSGKRFQGGTVIVGLQCTQHDAESSVRIFGRIDAVMKLLAEELGLNPVDEQHAVMSQGGAPERELVTEKDTHQSHKLVTEKDTHQSHKLVTEKDTHQSHKLVTEKDTHQSHRFSIPYDASTGRRLPESVLKGRGRCTTPLDLRPGSHLKVTSGPYAGSYGEVVGLNRQQHYKMRFQIALPSANKRNGDKRNGEPSQAIRKPFMAPFELMLGNWWPAEAESGSLDCFPVVNVTEEEWTANYTSEDEKLATLMKTNLQATHRLTGGYTANAGAQEAADNSKCAPVVGGRYVVHGVPEKPIIIVAAIEEVAVSFRYEGGDDRMGEASGGSTKGRRWFSTNCENCGE
jgi:NAD-dependent SIR2 family protein deacetylase